MKLVLAPEQRAAAESAHAVISKKHADCVAKQAEVDAARQLQVELDADAAKRKTEVDVRDSAGVQALLLAERKSSLNAGRLPEFETKLVEARLALAADVEPLPELLRGILSGAFDALIADMIQTLLPTFKDTALARAAAFQSDKVRKFRHFLQMHWALEPSQRITTAPQAIGWLQSLLDGELPTEVQ